MANYFTEENGFTEGWRDCEKVYHRPTVSTFLEWYPVFDDQCHLVGFPKGTHRIMVAMETTEGLRCDFVYWNQEGDYFSWDYQGKDPIYEQIVGTFTTWTPEPEAPTIW